MIRRLFLAAALALTAGCAEAQTLLTPQNLPLAGFSSPADTVLCNQGSTSPATRRCPVTSILGNLSAAQVKASLGFAPVKSINGTVADANGNVAIAAGGATTDASQLTAGTLNPARLPTLTGDVVNSSGGAMTLATVNSSPGTVGDGAHVAVPTVNAKGLVTGIASAAITPAGIGADVAGAAAAVTPSTLSYSPTSGASARAALIKLTTASALAPQEFGAVGDGATDDCTPLTNWLAAAASTGRTAYLRGGFYSSCALSITVPFGLIGDGPAASYIRFNGTNGLTLDLSNFAGNCYSSVIRGVGIYSKTTTPTGTGITVTGNQAQCGGPLIPAVLMQHMRVSGNGASTGWSTAVHWTDCPLCMATDSVFMGISSFSNLAPYLFYIDGNSTNIWFDHDSFLWAANELFNPVQTGSGVTEGVQIHHSQFLASRNAISLGSIGNGHFITNNDFDCSTRCIVLGSAANGGGGLSSISHNLFLVGNEEAPTDWAAIETFANYLTVDGNTNNGSHYSSYPTYFLKEGVGMSSGRTKLLAQGNFIRGSDTAFYLGAGAYQNYITGNSYDYAGNSVGALLTNASGATGTNAHKIFNNMEWNTSGVVMNTASGTTLPAFRLGITTDLSNITGDSTATQVAFSSTDYNYGNGASAGSGAQFVAPIAGVYHLSTTLHFKGITSAMTDGFVYLYAAGKQYKYRFAPNVVGGSASLEASVSFSVDAPMSASDTAYVVVQLLNGSKVAGLIAGTGPATDTSFSGYLVRAN